LKVPRVDGVIAHDVLVPSLDERHSIRENLSGLPSAWIGAGTFDLFHDEDR
jgi:hypothetical protein